MAARIKQRTLGTYEQDLCAWSKAQAGLLRAGRFAELDLEHLTEEIEDGGGAVNRSVRNRIRTIVEHLLKLEHSPAKEPRASWRATIRTQRVRLQDVTRRYAAKLRASWPTSIRVRAGWPLARSATTARARPPRRYRRPAPTVSTRSPPTGCPDRPGGEERGYSASRKNALRCAGVSWRGTMLSA